MDFERDVIAESRVRPVAVDFWASWCVPCQNLGPRLERLAEGAAGRWTLVKLNTEEYPDLANAYGVRSIPNVKLFVDGEVVDEFVGAIPDSEILRWIARHLPSPHAAVLDRARRFLLDGDCVGARAVLEPLLREDPDEAAARVLLAEALLFLEPASVDSILRQGDEDGEHADKVDGLRTLARLLAAETPDGAAAGGGPAAAALARGVAALRRREVAESIESFVEAIRIDRRGAGEPAAEACRALFRVLGLRHPVSEKFHRAFTSALYS